MTWTRTLATFVVLAAAIGTGAAWSADKKASGDAKSKQLARGEYLTTIMGCNDCHTPGTLYGDPDFSRKFAGSELGWRGPWGVSYPRNLTPHATTGLGPWTDKQIVDALRTGVRPNGTVLLPPMPWPMYTGLTDEDAYAIAAYLKSVPAIEHTVPAVVPPGQEPTGPFLAFPPPTPWDAPRSAPKPEVLPTNK